MLRPLSLEWNKILLKLDRLSGSRPASEDALQDAFLKLDAYRRQHPVTHPKAFLVRVAINLALNERRRMSRLDRGELSTGGETLPDDQPLQDEVLAARERLHVVRTALMTLSPRTREVFLMHRLEAMKYKDIAEHLAISVSAVEKHIAKATLGLTDAMHRYEEQR